MGTSSTVVKIQTDQSGLVEQLQQENKLLKEFIGQASIDEINRLKEVEKQLAVCQAQLTEKSKAYQDLKDEADKRVKLARESAERQGEQKRIQSLKDKDYNMKSKVVKPLRTKITELETENKELRVTNEDLMNKLGDMQDFLSDFRQENKELLDKIIGIITSASSIEEARQEVKKITRTANPSKEDIRKECDYIHQMLSQGWLKKDIADKLWPNTDRRYSKLTQRIQSKYYLEQYGKE